MQSLDPDPRVEGQVRVLEDDLDRAGPGLAGALAPRLQVQRLAADDDRSGVGELESDEHPRGRRLARPGLPDQPDGAPGPSVKDTPSTACTTVSPTV